MKRVMDKAGANVPSANRITLLRDTDGDGLGDGVGVGVGEGTGDGLGDGVGVGVGVGDGLGDGVGVGVGVGDGVGVGLGEGVGVGVGVAVGLGSGPVVGEGDGGEEGSGTGRAARFCGTGAASTTQSAAFWFVSVTFPALPPGLRSMLWPAGGADAAAPSTNGFVASPQPTASTGAPPTTRSTSAPPVAANPPEYVASAVEANTPREFATRRCRPVPRSSRSLHAAFLVTVDPHDVT